MNEFTPDGPEMDEHTISGSPSNGDLYHDDLPKGDLPDDEWPDDNPPNVADDERLLARFAQWLSQARAEADHLDRHNGYAVTEPATGSQVGLCRLVEEFTSLRQDVKLQARGSRDLQEQAETLVGALRQAIEAMRAIEPKEAQAAWTAGKALATALAELDDALDRGRQQTEKAALQLAEGPAVVLGRLTSEFYRSQSWLSRWLHGDYQRRLCLWLEQDESQSRREQLLNALVDGYGLVQKRLTQALAALNIARMATVGQPVDPELMTVVEVVAADDRPDGVVFDELRRGYTWNGRVLRYAEVRATRSGS